MTRGGVRGAIAREVNHVITSLCVAAWYRCAALCMPAPSPGSLSSPLGRPQPRRDFFGLLDVLISRAPEQQASGYAADGDGDPELSGDAQEPVFHRGRACAVREGHPCRCRPVGFDFLS